MTMGRPLSEGFFEPIKHRLATATTLLGCKFDLPIVYRMQGDVLIGELSIACSADLNKVSIEQAKRDIAMQIKAAFMNDVEKAAHPPKAA